ncbi:MAG: hypothetical protein JSR46_10880 [Verrucomicrobia bacterium]|nr:hypothetical protein [Verrucomicrobiota bacterium]
MRYLLCLIIGAALAYGYIYYYENATSHTDETAVSHAGFAHYGKETVSSLSVNGSLTLDGTRIKGLLEVNGKLDAQDATIGSIDVNGSVHLANCQVSGKTAVNGFFSATSSQFQDEITVSSQKVALNDSTAPSIVVRQIKWLPGTQTVELSHNSKIAGNITFESGKGKVILSDGSIVSGSVIGGEVENK